MGFQLYRMDRAANGSKQGERLFDLSPSHPQFTPGDIGELVEGLHAGLAFLSQQSFRNRRARILNEGIDEDIRI